MGVFRLIFVSLVLVAGVTEGFPFGIFYRAQWGGDHLIVSDDGNRVDLLLNESSGGAGFVSKYRYLSGGFFIRMKVPRIKSPGVLASFFLSGDRSKVNHDEIDFEFFGTDDQPTLSTNIFANDDGHREQVFRLWFDPTADFHLYVILWNPNQIVFLVDDIPIRFFKNNIKDGVNYPSSAMDVEASIWNAGFAGKINWANAPFIAQYKNFDNLAACATSAFSPAQCADPQLPWNKWTPTPKQLEDYENVRKNNMVFNYCDHYDKKECHLPN